MSLATNISRRVGSRNYYARVAVPKELQNRMGTLGKPKREIWKSLNTSDPREAKRLARPVVEAWERQFEELRLPHLSEAELQDAVWQRYLELITADEKFRQSMPSREDLDQVWKHLEAEFGAYELAATAGEKHSNNAQSCEPHHDVRSASPRMQPGQMSPCSPSAILI
jgi:hypothetical protein